MISGGIFVGCSAFVIYQGLSLDMAKNIFFDEKNDPNFIFQMLNKYQNHILNCVVVSQQQQQQQHHNEHECGNRKRNRTGI